MTPIRIYRDAWHGAVHEFHPRTGAGVRSLRAPAAPRPGSTTATDKPAPDPAVVRSWLDARWP